MPQHRGEGWNLGRPVRGQAGLTLVDVMVAMVIMALALLGLAAAIPLASSAAQQGWQESQAAAIAEDVFEVMRTTPYASITTGTFPAHTTVANYAGFSYTVAISESTPIANTKTVTIAVTYQPLRTGPVTISFSTIFALPAA